MLQKLFFLKEGGEEVAEKKPLHSEGTSIQLTNQCPLNTLPSVSGGNLLTSKGVKEGIHFHMGTVPQSWCPSAPFPGDRKDSRKNFKKIFIPLKKGTRRGERSKDRDQEVYGLLF